MIRRLLGSILWLAAFGVCLTPAVSFWQSRDSGYNVSVGGAPPAYTGPGDIVSANVYLWYGLRAYSSATRGNKAVNACNSTGGGDVCVDLLTDATTGNLVSQSVNGGTCPGANCTIKIWYDQTGALSCNGAACDATQATVANRSVLSASIIGSLPGSLFTGSSSQSYTIAVATTAVAVAQPCTFSQVVRRTAAFTTTGAWWGDSNTSEIAFNNATNQLSVFYGSAATVTVSDSAFHAIQVVANGASSDGVVDGSSNAISVGTNACVTANSVDPFGKSGFSNFLTGNINEFGMWKVAFSAGNKTSMNSNQHTYWGF